MSGRMLWRRAAALLLCCAALVCLAPAAWAQQPGGQAGALPGSELWQPYLDRSPAGWEDFVHEPLGTLRSFLPENLAGTVRQAVRASADALLFVLLAAGLAFLTAEQVDGELLDLVAAGGCGVLLWAEMTRLAQALSVQMEQWRSFLLGFLPVYAGVLTAGGEPAAGAAASGLLLSALCFLAQLLGAWVEPLLQCYLALSMASCISSESGLAVACRTVGRLLRQGLGWAGKCFVFLLGLQRVFALQLDRSAHKLGQLLTGTVPIIGQTLSGAAETVLSGMQLLKSGLGFAAFGILAVEFVPLYLSLLLQLGLLAGCSLQCTLAGVRRCAALLDCLREAVRCMAAATALFFGLTVYGTVLMLAVGGG